MKLYTEEQVKNALIDAKIYDFTIENIIEFYKPIELPSDEEIENHSRLYGIGFPLIKIGAKWVIEQIKNKQ